MPTRSTRSARPAKKPAKAAAKPAKAAAKPARKAPAKPARKPAAKRKAAPSATSRSGDARSRERALAVAQAGLAKKAEDVLVIDVRGLTSIADFFVVMSGSAGPQLRAIAEHVEVELKKQGAQPLSVEGQSAGNWVLLDFGDVVAHVFEPEIRGFYDLEGLWADAPRERITG